MNAPSPFAKLLEEYINDPVFYFEHALGIYTWSKMREIVTSVRNNQMTAVRATHGSSKTFTAAAVSIWFLNCFFNSRVITTAPTALQVKKLLWAEINKLYRIARVRPEGQCFQTSIKTENGEHDAIGFATSDGAKAEGFHAPEILFIFDEAKGIESWMWDAVMGSMTGGYCRWLAISTTDGAAPGEDYYDIFMRDLSNDWNKIHIDCRDTPYFTGEEFRGIQWVEDNPFNFDYKYSSSKEKEAFIQLATPDWEQKCINKWGEDSILYYTKCRGQIIDDAPDTIIPLSHIYKMFANYTDKNFDDTGVEEIGVDVARFGDDSSVFFKKKGLGVIAWEKYNKQDTVFIAGKVRELADYDKEMRIKVDDTGVGGGVTDILRNDGYMNVMPVNFNGKAKNEDKFPNAISEMWFEVAELVTSIACPQLEQLQIELVNRKRKDLDNKGRRVVEAKKDYKKRLGGKSPDFADAFLLTFYNPKPNKRKLIGTTTGKRFSKNVLEKYKF